MQNALSQTALTGYDVETSLPTFYTDSNGNVTAYGYEPGGQPDPFNRVTSIVVAGGASSTTYSYPSLKQVTTTRDQTSAACPQSPTSLVSDIFYDGLGRQIQTVLHDSSGNITTEKVYDFLGRPYSASSPHRASDAVNLTLSTFDALGRISQVKTSSDSAIVYSGYVGNAAFVVDQAGKWRETQTDALGRVTSVIEDPTVALNSPQNPFSGLGLANASGANLTTSYVYDARDDLTNVTQGQETRQFAYDSLKRLTSANNPESGVTTYLYYDTGTLQQKQSGASVTTSFAYDALNRITNKSYAGDGGLTPAVTYCYDGVIGGGACSTAPNAGLNLVGKLTMVTSAAATRRYTAYDALGRVLTNSQQLPTQASPNTSFYTYNRAGGLETETYPSNRIVKTCYDSAARIQSVAAGATNYASGMQYAAHGAVTSMTFGDGLVESTTFNPRQQPTQIQASSLLTLNYTYGAANNNGNVLTQKINDGGT